MRRQRRSIFRRSPRAFRRSRHRGRSTRFRPRPSSSVTSTLLGACLSSSGRRRRAGRRETLAALGAFTRAISIRTPTDGGNGGDVFPRRGRCSSPASLRPSQSSSRPSRSPLDQHTAQQAPHVSCPSSRSSLLRHLPGAGRPLSATDVHHGGNSRPGPVRPGASVIRAVVQSSRVRRSGDTHLLRCVAA